MSDAASQDDVKAIDELKATYDKITAEMKKVIHGQEDVIEKLLI